MNYSEMIGLRISQAMALRQWTKSRLAKELGITHNTLSRILSGQERLNMNCCCNAMKVMGFPIDLLLSDEPIIGNWTGIRQVDEMLTEIYGEQSTSGLDNIRGYLTNDYICCSPHYSEEHNKVLNILENGSDPQKNKVIKVSDKKQNGYDLLGITFELEHYFNTVNSYIYTRAIKLASLMDEYKVFVISEFKKAEKENSVILSSEIIHDLYYLKNSFSDITKGAPVRVYRKLWFGKSQACSMLD